MVKYAAISETAGLESLNLGMFANSGSVLASEPFVSTSSSEILSDKFNEIDDFEVGRIDNNSYKYLHSSSSELVYPSS